MSISEYHFVMRTPNGIRIGNISLDFDKENRICGCLELPQFTNRFSGVVYDNGTLRVVFEKSEESFLSELTGEGRISFHALSISITSDDFVYELNGTSGKIKV